MAKDYRIGLNPEAERLMYKIRDEFRLTNSTITNLAYFALRRMLKENGGDEFMESLYEDYQRYVMRREREEADGYQGALMRAQRAFGTGGDPGAHVERTKSGIEVARAAKERPGPGDPGYMSPRERKRAAKAASENGGEVKPKNKKKGKR